MSSPLNRRQFMGIASTIYGSLKWPKLLQASDRQHTYHAVPGELPLLESPTSGAKWIQRAVVLQPWGPTEHTALAQGVDISSRFRKEFGFNAIIVLPTEAHNALIGSTRKPGDPDYRLTDSQFRAGLSAYRKENYKIILYSSVMHCGHAPMWESGDLEREHPDWLQRDAFGHTIRAFGHPWLCPSSPARAYTLNYTLKLARDYSPDAIMLDNNGFGHTGRGFACYCGYCERAFQEYVLTRCGASWVQNQLPVDPDTLRIPVKKGPLWALWMLWRSRVWAEVNEVFRSRLRQIKSDIVFFVNTQYDQTPDPQATRLQFSREDLVFSETHESDSWYISKKLVLGQAFTQGYRPLWNYIATFQDGNISRLRSPAVVSLMISSTLAHGALPWICYLGLDNARDQQARKEIGRYVSWYAAHPELFCGRPSAPIGAVVSLLNRDIFATINYCPKEMGVTGCTASADTPALIPEHIGLLLRSGMPVIALREGEISPEKLQNFRMVTLATGKNLGARQAAALASWVRAGGILIAAPDAGEYDELGRKLSRSTLCKALDLTELSLKSQRIGLGTVQAPTQEYFDGAVLTSAQSAKAGFSVPQGIEVVYCQNAHRNSLHIVQHETNTGSASLVFPDWLTVRAGSLQWFSPDWEQPRKIDFRPGTPLNISELPTYSVIVLS
jgi:hypothetical protein